MASDPNQFRVNPATGRLGTMQVPSVQNYGGQQLQQMGRAITQAGGVAARLHMETLQQANAAAVNEAAIRAKELELDLTYGDAGYTKIKGKAAIERPDGSDLTTEYLSQYGQGLSEIESGLANDAQRRAFARFRQQSELGLRSGLERHTAGELRTWRMSNNRGMTKVLSDTIAMSWGDPAATEQAVAQLKANIGGKGGLAELTGMGAAEVEATTKAILGQAHAAAIDQMIAEGKWNTAQEYLNLHRQDMDGDAQFKASAKIDGEGRVALGVQAGDQIADAYLRGQALSGPQKFMAPVQGNPRISSGFGTRDRPNARASRNHGGIDYAVPVGTPVAATADGVGVVKRQPKGAGLYVEIDHGGGYKTLYMHLDSTSLKEGQRVQVRQGDVIGKSGNSGNSTGPHLHYEVRKDGRKINPLQDLTVNRPAGRVSGGLSEALRTAREQFGDDPRMAKIAEARIRERFQARDYDKRASEGEARDNAIALMAERGVTSFFDLPPGVRASVDPSDIPSLISFGNSMKSALTGPGVTTDQSAEMYGAVMDGIVARRITSTKDLAQYKPFLTAGHYTALANKIASASKPGAIDSIASTNKAMSLFKTEIAAAGIKAKDTDEGYQRLKGQAYIEIDRAERIKKAPLTSAEQRNIILGLLAESATDGGWFSSAPRNYELAPTERRVVYSAIPRDKRKQIADRLLAQGVAREDVTQGRIEDEYMKELAR